MPHIKIEGLLLKVDGSTEVIDINDRNKPLKGYVDGWIQCVDAPSLGISFVIDRPVYLIIMLSFLYPYRFFDVTDISTCC